MMRRFGKCLTHLGCSQDGSAGLEFAIVGPVLALALLAGADLGLGIWKSAQVANAAREGAQYALLNNANTAGIVTAATGASRIAVSATATSFCACADGASLTPVTCGLTCSGMSAGTYVRVNTQANYTPISPIHWGATTKQLTAVAVARIN